MAGPVPWWLKEAPPDPELEPLAGDAEADVAVVGDVWLRKAGMLEVSTTRAQDEAVDDALRAAADLGVPERAVPLSGAEFAERCSSAAFRRGVWFPCSCTPAASAARRRARTSLPRALGLRIGRGSHCCLDNLDRRLVH